MFVLPIARSSLRPYRHTQRPLDNAASLAQVIDRLFHDVRTPTPAAAVRTPALDVDETSSHYLLTFDLPGAAKDGQKVSIEGRRVRIETLASEVAAADAAAADDKAADTVVQSGAVSAAPAVDADVPRSLYRERSALRYARTVSLPQEVDSDASEARLDNGVLTLRLAKRRVDGARRLSVN